MAQRAKALKRRIEEDYRNAQKVREVEKKAQIKKQERQANASGKASKKANQMGMPKDKGRRSLAAESPTYKPGSQAQTYSSWGTLHNSFFEILSQVSHIEVLEEAAYNIDEYIVNSSLYDVLSGSSTTFLLHYEGLKLFNFKVRCSNHL